MHGPWQPSPLFSTGSGINETAATVSRIRRRTPHARPSRTQHAIAHCARCSAMRSTNRWPVRREYDQRSKWRPTRSNRSTEPARTPAEINRERDGRAVGVVTFLFTDIEGSTRRWEADPDAMRVALEAHNEVLRDAVEAHGVVFNHTGDGMCAVFTSPRSAVDAAVAAQLALELPVRRGSPPVKPSSRRRLLRRRAQSHRARDGGRPRRPDPARRRHSGSDQWRRADSLGPRRLRDIANPSKSSKSKPKDCVPSSHR